MGATVNAEPGWYQAEPGTLRWWDGSRWTDHVTSMQPVVPAPQQSQAAFPLQARQATTNNVGMGWYETPTGPIRWWDGRHWTGFIIARGLPKADGATIDQPALAWVFGAMFLSLAVLQALLNPITSIATFALAAIWWIIAFKSSAVRRIAAPTSQPVLIDETRPLPGEQEGPGSGWYPVTPQATRWWTGSRWSQYTGSRVGVRPTFHGATAIRRLLVFSWSILGVGVVSIIVAIVLLFVGAADPSNGVLTGIGVFLLMAGIVLSVLGPVLLAMSRTQKRLLLLPEAPPDGSLLR